MSTTSSVLKPILRVNVDISNIGSVPLILHEGDDPVEVVRSFSAPYGMDEPTITALVEHVKSSIQALVPEEARKYALRYSRPTIPMSSSRGRGGRLWSGGRKPPPSLTGSFLGSPSNAKSADSFRHKTPVSGPNGLLGALIAKEQPPSVRHRAATPTKRSPPSIADKLYEDAAWIRERRELMRQRAEYLRSQQEMEDVTFRPVVNSHSLELSSRMPLQYHSQATNEKKSLDFQLQRLAKRQAEISECTFKPTVSRKSPPLPPGKVFDALYQEAQRRQERREFFQHPQALASDVPTPRKILSAKQTEELTERLSRKSAKSAPVTPRVQTPAAHRQPAVARSLELNGNSFSSTEAKGRALYAAAVERRREKERELEEARKRQVKNPEICANSKTIMQERKRRVFEKLFATLSGGAETLAAGNCVRRLESIEDARLRDLVRPIAEFVSQHSTSDSQFPITFDRFSAALDVRLSQAAAPTGSLLLGEADKVSGESSSSAARRTQSENFRPRLSARNGLRRDVNVPLHEALWKSQEATEARLHKLREEKRAVELAECTFRPCLAKPYI